MIDLTRLASWLRCPVCGQDLAPVDRLTLGCASGHRHDVNKRGYVSLLGGGSKYVGDTAEMLDARDTVLEGGAYAPIAAAVAAAVAPAVGAHSPSVGAVAATDAPAVGGHSPIAGAVAATDAPSWRVLDAGAGTGYYLRGVLAGSPGAIGLAMDLSPTAVARAVRSSPDVDGLVADTWRPLPVRSHSVDAVLDVFAPRNLPEFHRVLRPGGTLAVVVPRADHLASLRAAGTMLDIPSDKAEDVIEAVEPLYAPLTREHVTYELALDDTLRAALAAMGPSARHAAAAPAATDATTVSVDVLAFTAR